MEPNIDFKKPHRVKVDALAYLSDVLKDGITKDLQEHQILCPTCQGTGLAVTDSPYGLSNDPDKKLGHFPYRAQYIQSCHECFSGVVNLCKHCNAQLPRGRSVCECDESQFEFQRFRAEREAEKIDKGIKLKHDDDIAKNMGMYYSDSYPFNEGYFTDFDEFFEEWESNHELDEERPKYVWGTECRKLTLDAENIIENATDDLHEEAYNNIEDIDGLQKFLDEWSEKQRGTETYYMTSKYAIEIPWEETKEV